MTDASEPGLVGEGRAAFGRSDWRASFDALTHADRVAPLGPDDLGKAAEAAMWIGEFDACIEFRQRAFAASIAGGDAHRAAGLAIELCMDHVHRHRAAVAIGWAQRAERLLEGSEPCSELGLMTVLRAIVALEIEHDVEAAARYYDDAIQIGRTSRDGDIVALALLGAGTVMVRVGRVPEGMRLVDEAMTDAVAGLLGPVTTARVYCGTISLCQALGDVRRASEWTEQAVTCGSRPGMAGFPGDCRLHRAEITRLRGDWPGAETEVRLAMRELERWDLAHVGQGWYELGEIALRRGDLGAADEAFRQATTLGKQPEPGLARLRLAQGEEAEASALLRAALDGAGDSDPLAVAQLLPALVEVRLACGDVAGASEAAAQLEALADRYRTVVVQAQAAMSGARVALATGDTNDAVGAGRAAVALWRDAGAPYETAQAQSIVAEASLRSGDREVAIVEIEAALSAFVALGAIADVELGRRLRARLGEATSGHRVRRTFMFTDIVDSTPLVATMGDERWSSVLRWHDRAIREALANHDGVEVKQRGGGDGFFAVFLVAKHAMDCAIDIQRGFADHRDANGFAPELRIGVHETDALLSGGDYAGLGVHEAARIAGHASGGEILSSEDTVASADTVAAPPERVALRGLTDTMALQLVAWAKET
ncbi:MAG: hypothetical protein M3Q30_10900 [Actinomycetota bacterium]|nr:hypothetical protein [Actinomycetota bacterium]